MFSLGKIVSLRIVWGLGGVNDLNFCLYYLCLLGL